MKKTIVSIIVFGVVVLVACQKEIDWGLGSNGAGTTLVKIFSRSGTDSVITVYTYDGNKKLINEKITGTSQGTNVGNEVRYYRTAGGIIDHFVQINAQLVLLGVDSVTYLVHYDAAASRYTSSVFSLSLFGFTVLDSSVLAYDVTGKVIRSDIYQSIPLLAPGYQLSAKTNYTYAANGNMNKQTNFSHDPVSGTDSLVNSISYTFDSKTSAISTNNEAFIILHPDWVSLNNPIVMDLLDPATPANDQTANTTYTYNLYNRPATGVRTRTPGPVVDSLKFYYQ